MIDCIPRMSQFQRMRRFPNPFGVYFGCDQVKSTLNHHCLVEYSFVRLLVCLFVCLLVLSFVCLFVCLFACVSVCVCVCLLACSFVRLFVPLYVSVGVRLLVFRASFDGCLFFFCLFVR